MPQPLTGNIKLINHFNEVVEHSKYSSKEGREKIIERWSRVHAGLFLIGVSVQICPRFFTCRILENGMNSTKAKRKPVESNTPVKLIRPPAIYNNLDQNGYGIARGF